MQSGIETPFPQLYSGYPIFARQLVRDERSKDNNCKPTRNGTISSRVRESNMFAVASGIGNPVPRSNPEHSTYARSIDSTDQSRTKMRRTEMPGSFNSVLDNIQVPQSNPAIGAPAVADCLKSFVSCVQARFTAIDEGQED